MTDSNHDEGTSNDQTIPVFFLFFMLLLALVLLLGRALHNRPRLNSYLSEPAMVLLVSVFFSFLVKILVAGEDFGDNQDEQDDVDDYYAYNDNDDQEHNNAYHVSVDQNQLSMSLLTFSGEVFFMVFLPPIMFNSGYELKRELFFRHIKPIISFAVIGTAFSGFVTGMILWGASSLGLTGDVDINLWELLTFGSLITATDTVSVLGVLNAKQVNPHLFSLVFGESAFNDAVAIVLFQSFSHLVRMGGISSQQSLVDEATHFAIEFFVDVLGCPMLGMTISFMAALVFKLVDFHQTPVLELSLYLLIMYIPFILAEVLGMSGIITIFVTGMFARRYIEPNVSDETRHNAEVIFSLVAYLAETCIFLSLGLSVFGFSGSFHWAFIGCALVASLIGRAMSIYPISFLYNWSLTEKVEEPLDSPPSSSSHHRQTTIDMVANYEMEDDSVSVVTNCDSVDGVTKFTVMPPTPTRKVRRTPVRKLDKVIPTKFMHFLWFAGLRGAVAYACARDFPDAHGNRSEIVAATMVIVFFSIIVMGAGCEPLLRALNIRTGVNNDEYMREWRNRRSLEGRFHTFEKEFIYDVVVREEDIELAENSFHLTVPDDDSIIFKTTERATTASRTVKTLTGSESFTVS